jgi:ferredoxin
MDQPLIDTECRFCGACVEVCPTGAIQDIVGVFSKEGPRDMKLVPCKNDCLHIQIYQCYIRLTKEGKYSDAVSVIRKNLRFLFRWDIFALMCVNRDVKEHI